MENKKMKKSDMVPGLRVSLVREDHGAVPVVGNTISAPKDAAALVRQFIPTGDEREYFVTVLLDARSGVKGVCTVSIGTLSASLVHPREVFRPAIIAGAAAVIVAHNHPSGDCEPSAEDKETTRRLGSAGKLLGIPVQDHIILGIEEAYYSFKSHGLI